MTKLAFAPVDAELTMTEHTASKPVHLAATTHSTVQHLATKITKPTHTATQPVKAMLEAPEGQSDQADRLPFCRPNWSRRTMPARAPSLVPRPPPRSLGRMASPPSALIIRGRARPSAIVDEYHDPNITADANAFSTQYGLQVFNVTGGPVLTIYKDTTFVRGGQFAGRPSLGTSIETSLTVEWVHAMGPKANILLVEVPAANDLPDGVQGTPAWGPVCRRGKPVSPSSRPVTAMSRPTSGFPFGGHYRAARPSIASIRPTCATGAGTNVVVTVSSGDKLAPPVPGQLAQRHRRGRHRLAQRHRDQQLRLRDRLGRPGDQRGGRRRGPPPSSPTRSFQTSNGVTNYNGHRNLPDVSLIADPVTGVSVYDSYDTSSNGGNPCTSDRRDQPGGAGLRRGTLDRPAESSSASKPILSSVQINNALYGLYNSAGDLGTHFHVIIQGSNSEPRRPSPLAGHQGHDWLRPGDRAGQPDREQAHPLSRQPLIRNRESPGAIPDPEFPISTGFPATIGNLKSGI